MHVLISSDFARRRWPPLLGRLLLIILCAAPGIDVRRVAAHEHDARPNIILIVADDLGFGDLGCYGQQLIRTPHLDRLASRGLRWTQHYSGAPVCAPSRCVLLTGLHSGHAEIRDNREHQPEGQYPLSAQAVTMATYLQQAGYVTGAIGKWGLGYPGSTGDPLQQGFQHFFGYNCQRHAHSHYPTYLWNDGHRVSLRPEGPPSASSPYAQDLFSQATAEFLRSHQHERFFLYLPWIIPHVSLQVPDDEVAPYRATLEETPYTHRDAYVAHPTPHAAYAAMVTRLDRAVGELVQQLDAFGLSHNTWVIFTSDNGPTHERVGGADSAFFRSAGPLRGLKGSVYEGGLRVPLIMTWPAMIKQPRVSDELTASWDLLPTMLAAINRDPRTALDGINLLPLLKNEPLAQPHPYLVWHFAGYGGQQAIRLPRWKGVRRDLDTHPDAPLELYEFPSDLAETTDVAAHHRSIVAEMESILASSQTRSAEFGALPWPQATR